MPAGRSLAVAAVVLAGLAAGCGKATGAPLGDPTGLVPVGPGASETSIRQVARTPDGRVYIAAVDDNGGQAGRLRMFRAQQLGIPTSFAEVDAAHAASAVGNGQTMSGADVRLDRSGTIHLAYYRTDTAAVVHQTFSTANDTWGPAETVTTLAGAQNNGDIGRRGRHLAALALDADDTPYVAVTSPGPSASSVTVYRRGPGGWSVDATLDSAVGSHNFVHPSLTFDRGRRLHLAWLDEPVPAIRYAVRAAGGGWSAVQTVAAGASSVLNNQSLDQSPSVAVDGSDRPVVLYLDPQDHVRVRSPDANGWTADDPSPAVYTHTPGLYLSGDDRFVFLGHDASIHPAYDSRAAGSSSWSDLHVFAPPSGVSTWAYDGSASPRFDPLYETDCHIVDVAFMDEDSDTRGGFKPDLYYAAVKLPDASAAGCPRPGTGPGPTVGNPGVADRIVPSVRSARMSPRAFRAGDARAKLYLTLSENATLQVRIERALAGRRRRTACIVQARAGSRCTAWRGLVTLRAQRLSGRRSVVVGTRVRRRPVGRYRLVIVASDAAGNRSARVVVPFRLLAPRR